MNIDDTVLVFNRSIINATCEHACAFKLNTEFYFALGGGGMHVLLETIKYIHEAAPDVPVILDRKAGDIGNTNLGTVTMAFDYLQADAITVNPYLGREALEPFLDRKEKGVIVLCRTSNTGAGEFQDLIVRHNEPLYQHIARSVAYEWNRDGNCMLVVGATNPAELKEVRAIVGGMPILIPGVGAQGGDVKEVVMAGRDSLGKGILINSSRAIIFASSDIDFSEVARRETVELNTLINKYIL